MLAVRMKRAVISRLFSGVMILALILGIAGLPSDVSAFNVTITVFTAADNTTQEGLCSLREAITNANNNARTFVDCSTGLGSEIINFSSGLGSATILLSSPLPPISDVNGLTMVGGGKITVSGGGLYQVFALNANVPLTLNGMTVANGHNEPNGGGVFVGSGAQLTVLDSTFSHNSATAPGAFGLGGGVDNHGTLIISNSTFSNNSADNTGGALINNAGTLTITNSTFSDNSSGYGGALRSFAGTISITNSSFSGNSASSYGGAIYHSNGDLTVKTSTFSTNTANLGGAISNIANLTITNSTFYTNSASIGGAISNSFIGSQVGNATILNSTFSANTAIFSGFGVVYSDAQLSLSNSLIANSGVGSGDCAGTLTAGSGHNLFENATDACGQTNGVNGNIVGTDPNLGPGAGSPVYLPLNGGSAAINTGDDAVCAAEPVNNTSQNGRSRPDGAHCDIGAYEADATPPTVLSITRADPSPTSAGSVNFTVTFSEPVYGVTVGDFFLTATGVSGGSVVSLSSPSPSTRTVTVNTGSGSGTLRLDLIDRDTILDAANLYLGGTGLGNGSFNTGEVYIIQKGVPSATPTKTPTVTPTASLTRTLHPTITVTNTPTATPTSTASPFQLNLPLVRR
jgi:CSLREA domain-containing protein